MKLRHLFLNTLLMAFAISVQGQNVPGSSITSRTMLSSDGTQAIEQQVYDNGLGDVVREITSYPGSNIPDVVVHHEYDTYRRKTKTWLPVTFPSGSGFVSNNILAYQAMTQYSDPAPFSRTEYDSFLQSQPSAQYKAGSQWQNNDKKMSVSYGESLVTGILFYEENILYPSDEAIKYLCNQTVDEDGCPSIEYTDLNGRLMISETSQGRTYYVYDEETGDMVYVLPPPVSNYIVTNFTYYDDIPDTDEMVQKYAYIYRYDKQRHCIYKKLPGCEPIYYVYDRTGNCILTQDGNQRQRGEWSYSIPDKFGRPCISGICHNNVSYSAEPLHPVHVYAEYNGMSVQTGGYAVHNLTLNSQTLYSAAYYDNYGFIGQHGVPTSMSASNVSGFSVDSSLGHGLQTGSAMAYIDDNGVAGYTYSTIFYDSRYNVAQVKSTNHINGTDITATTYSYTGKPHNIKIQHIRNGASTLVEDYTYNYDVADRLETVSHNVGNGNVVTLQQNSYNGLGQLAAVTKPINGTHVTAYSYDMHSWLTGIDAGNLFQENLLYANSSHGPCYNGNISVMEWKAADTNILRGYRFSYDNASELVRAIYTEGGSNRYGKYNTSYKYDCMGNVTEILRKGQQDDGRYNYIDNLTMGYDGNHLIYVSDTGSDPTYNNVWNFTDGSDCNVEYEYDANGNLTKDLNKKISSIQYNSLNLPSKITFSDGKTIKYTYSADGHKLSAAYTTSVPATTQTIDYFGNVIIGIDNDIQILVDGGYVTFDGDNHPVYHFYIQDHLGNNRVVAKQDGTVEQVNHYYPYGGLAAESMGWNEQRYKYNGKELDRMHGLDWYDYGARHYDAVLNRWTTMDPLCEKYYCISPYAYCAGNPINYIDPDGKKIRFAAGVSSDFKQDFKLAINYMNKHNAGGVLAQLEKSSEVYYLKETKELESKYVNGEKTIYWNPRVGFYSNSGEQLSPTVVLIHETAHALGYDQDPEQVKRDRNTVDEDFINKEEKRVILGPETEAARKLKEIGPDVTTRTKYGDVTPFNTNSPTSNIDKYEEDMYNSK